MKEKILLWLITISFTFQTFLSFSQSSAIPKVFKIDWGTNKRDVERIVTTNIKLSPLKYFQTTGGKDELSDIRSSASVKYISNGTPFFDIPADIIFTFFNSNNSLDGLKLAKVEIYMKKKYNDGSWVNTKSIYKNLISIYTENYEITLTPKDESLIFSRWDYEIIVNGIYSQFVADIGNGRLPSEYCIYFTYENNKIKNDILKKELELEKERIKLSPTKNQEKESGKL